METDEDGRIKNILTQKNEKIGFLV